MLDVGFQALRISLLEFVYFLELFLKVAVLGGYFLGFDFDFSPFSCAKL